MHKIAFIMPVYKRFDLAIQTVASVDSPIVPYIIPNYIFNRGVAGSWNYGMKTAMADGLRYGIITNDDVVFNTPGAINILIDNLLDGEAVLASPNQRNQLPPQGVQPGADFFCFAVDMVQLVDRVGWFDENFYPAYFEDNDMHWRIKLAEADCYINTEVIVDHIGSATQSADPANPVVTSKRFEEHREYYKRKWGGGPAEEVFSRPFNMHELSHKDWNGSCYLDGQDESRAQIVLDTIYSDCPAH